MHLLIEENSAFVRMNKVAVMKSDNLLRLEDNRRAEERSRLNCADLPQTSLTDGQNTDLLQCQDSTDNSSTNKYRRYGYEPICLGWKYTCVVKTIGCTVF